MIHALFLNHLLSAKSFSPYTGRYDNFPIGNNHNHFREVTWISSYSCGSTPLQTALADVWPTSPNSTHPKGAGKWPVCPTEEDYSAGKHCFHVIRVTIQLQVLEIYHGLSKALSTPVGGGYTARSFDGYNLPRNVVDQLVSTSNASLASSTWSKYQATDRLVRTIESHYDRQLPFPFSETSTLLFCCYLLTKGYKSETIECHLSSLRNTHLTKGLILQILDQWSSNNC